MPPVHPPGIRKFIRKNSDLFWYVPEDKKEAISLNLLVETILNYGDMSTVKELFSLVGLENVADILEQLKGREKMNYYPEIYNYFSLIVKKYAPRRSE